MIRTFKHKILNFSTIGILSHFGITPQSGVMYYQLLVEVQAVIETQVLATAQRLNTQLKGAYRRDMSSIPEYSRFPPYFTVVNKALSHPRNIGSYWDNKGLIQAKFVDIDALGDIGDLQRIQKMVHPGGTLQGWIAIYNNWLHGRDNKYEEIVDARIAIMLSETKAPFVEYIEIGNPPTAYPRNFPMRTLLKFKATYDREMKAAYLRTLSIVGGLVSKVPMLSSMYQPATVSHGGKTFSGHSWVSSSGRTIFAISGMTVVDKLGHLTGKGFIMDTAGVVIKKWGGLIPR